MPDVKPEYLLMFVGFVLPGAISMYVYGLKVPQRDHPLKDKALEAICFSVLNFIMLYWPIEQLVFIKVGDPEQSMWVWAGVVLCFVMMPCVWPFLLILGVRLAESQGWIALRARTAWDWFFEKQDRGCWVQVVMVDGSTIGGRYDKKSYATASPDPGHLFIEELWTVDADGRFVDPMNGSPGVILRPTDYKYVKVFVGGSDGRKA